MAEGVDRSKSTKTENQTSEMAAAAIALEGASRDEAELYLQKQRQLADEQIALTRLQAHELKDELRLHGWSVRVRHISDLIKLSFELATAFILLAIAVAIGGAVWSASQADGLVIRAFQVPAAMAAHGLSGQVVANKLLDRLTLMQNTSGSNRAASSFASDWSRDITVEIPDTGISLGEVLNYLRSALGHETRLSGEVYDTKNGIALTLRFDNEPGETFEGKTDDLNAIVERAAESVYRKVQPYRYSAFLANTQGRYKEAAEVLRELARDGSRTERAWANNGLAIHAEAAGQYPLAEHYVRLALAENPDLPNPVQIRFNIDLRRGRDEDALADARGTMALYQGAGAHELNPTVIAPALNSLKAKIAEFFGDYQGGIGMRRAQLPIPGSISASANVAFVAFDAIMLHDPATMRATLDTLTPADLDANVFSNLSVKALVDRAYALAAISLEDWSGAVKQLEDSESVVRRLAIASGGTFDDGTYRHVLDGPWLAYAYAKECDQAKADAILSTLASDCYICTELRGRIAAARGHADAAAYWFARATAQAPSLPFAQTDWGEALLRRGDYEGAIAKFREANLKGPHFADPLEMWGEALMLENRSDLALAKFAEAGKYAPNWGRLHLEWSKALFYLGRKDEAKTQFALAAHLDLSAADKTDLAKWLARSR